MLEGILARNDDVSQLLFHAVRPEQVAASGASFGGYAAMALAGGDDQVCGTLDTPLPVACTPIGTTEPDPRIRAIVPLDGSSWALHFSELTRITVPSLAVGRPYETSGTEQARQHAAISAHPNYRVDVRNAVHPSFAGNCTVARLLYAKSLISLTQLQNTLSTPQCTTAIDQREANRLAAKYAIAFLKTELAGETGYQHILTPGWALTMEKDIEFFVTEPAAGPHEDPATFRFFPHQPGSGTKAAPKDPTGTVIEGPTR
jgi:predicted dienelactone hydrolase